MIDGSIIYTDCINETIKEISKFIDKVNNKKILILFDKQNKKKWLNCLKNYNYIAENDVIKDIGSNISLSKVSCLDKLKKNNYDVIIYDNTKFNSEYFNIQNCKKFIYV